MDLVRQTDQMPRTPEPLDPANPDLDVATAVMGNRNKSLIVRHLWQNGPTTGPELQRATGLLGPTLSLATQQLEEWGVVVGSLPTEMRHGRAVTYTLDTDRLRDLIRMWMEFVTGEDPAS